MAQTSNNMDAEVHGAIRKDDQAMGTLTIAGRPSHCQLGLENGGYYTGVCVDVLTLDLVFLALADCIIFHPVATQVILSITTHAVHYRVCSWLTAIMILANMLYVP